MGRIRKFGVAIVMACVMAGGLGTTAQAASKKPGGGNGAICAYLEAVITYEYVTPTVLAYALALWNYFDCN